MIWVICSAPSTTSLFHLFCLTAYAVFPGSLTLNFRRRHVVLRLTQPRNSCGTPYLCRLETSEGAERANGVLELVGGGIPTRVPHLGNLPRGSQPCIALKANMKTRTWASPPDDRQQACSVCYVLHPNPLRLEKLDNEMVTMHHGEIRTKLKDDNTPK